MLARQPMDVSGTPREQITRWDKITQNWENCGLTRHFQQHHLGDLEEALAGLQVTLVDHLVGRFSEERLLQLEKDWIQNMGTWGPTGLNSRNQLLSSQRRNWGSS